MTNRTPENLGEWKANGKNGIESPALNEHFGEVTRAAVDALIEQNPLLSFLANSPSLAKLPPEIQRKISSSESIRNSLANIVSNTQENLHLLQCSINGTPHPVEDIFQRHTTEYQQGVAAIMNEHQSFIAEAMNDAEMDLAA